MKKQFKWNFLKHFFLSVLITGISLVCEFIAIKILNIFSLNFKLDIMNKVSNLNTLGSVGIIGGADGPTMILLGGNFNPYVFVMFIQGFIMLAVLLVLYIPIALYIKKAADK
jgi:Na+-transporting methylmalonyl-CoA/oxaloacetate decarboxylase beta subunit